MKKFKKLWENNKFAIIVCTILLVCICAIAYVALTYFFGGSDSVYGERLKDISKHEITEKEEKKVIKSIKENEKVETANINIKGKVIYINVDFTEDTSLAEAQKTAVTSLEHFDKEALEYYDYNYIIYYEEDSVLMGYKNSSSSIIVWNNNTDFDDESE